MTLTSTPSREWHRERGLLEELPPRGKRSFSIEIGVVEGVDAIDALLASLGHEPPKKPAKL